MDWQNVPPQFHFLRNSVIDSKGDDLGTSFYDHDLGRHVASSEKLSAAELAEISPVYLEILRRKDNLAIVEWVEATKAEFKPYSTLAVPWWQWIVNHIKNWRSRHQAQAYHSASVIWFFLVLLRELGERQIPPFNEQLIVVSRPEPPLDWTTLPPELEYIGKEADYYRDLWTEAAILDWLDVANSRDLSELRKLNQQMLKDNSEIVNWAREHRGAREEFRVYWFNAIFDHAGMPTLDWPVN